MGRDRKDDRAPLVRAAGGLVLRHRGDRQEVVVVHRPRYDDWSLPKGKIGAGETWEQAAIREVREETGIDAEIVEPLEVTAYWNGGRPKVVAWYLMRPVAEQPHEPDNEIDVVRWIEVDDATSVLTHADEAGVLWTGRTPRRFPEVGWDELGAVDASQMLEVDRVMVEDLGIELLQMMENAGRNLARLVLDGFGATSVVVLAGSGGNGGGGITAARHLANAGVDVRVVLSRPATELGPVPRRQHDIVDRMGVPVSADATAIDDADVVIDALVGYSLHGDPRGRTAALIHAANDHPAPVVALDVPSGVDSSTGRIGRPAIRATATLTLALPKTGFRPAADAVGDLYVADISVPPLVYEQLGVGAAPGFAAGPILRVR